MDVRKRVKKVVNWLIFNEIAENERAISELLGYTKSSFSQIMTGKVPVSEKFIKNLCSLDKNINFVWVQTGEGEMFLNHNLNGELTVQKDVWKVIQQQAESLSARDRQIDELMGLLKEQIQVNKKILARPEENASSADAV